MIEKTSSYVYDHGVPERIFAMDPNIKLILTVRDPIERLISKFVMDKRRGDWNGGLEETFLLPSVSQSSRI